jgi:molybdate transport system regulatory protein
MVPGLNWQAPVSSLWSIIHSGRLKHQSVTGMQRGRTKQLGDSGKTSGMDRSIQVFGGIWMGRNDDSKISDVRISLLEKIGEFGSITQAAKAVGISYKTAWEAVDVMNNLSGGALVESATGGKGGGGTRLTDAGKKLIQTYQMIQKEHERFLSRIREGVDDFDNFYPIIRRLSMKNSARNQFFGRVTQILTGSVSSEIRISISDKDEIEAIITHESLENLEIKVGCEIWVLIKSSSVILGTEDDNLKLSVPNCMHGTVLRMTQGKDSSDVVLMLDGGNTVSAIVNNESIKRMGLKEGIKARALFHASSIILGMPG